MAAKTNERISFDKIENGFLVNHIWEENSGKDYKYVEKKYFTKIAKETKTKIAELLNNFNIK